MVSIRFCPKHLNKTNFRKRSEALMLSMNQITKLVCCLMLICPLVLGCGGTAAQAPTGLDLDVTITKGGKPLPHAEVNFMPVDGSPRDAIFAQADAQGPCVRSLRRRHATAG
jgi:hypothetical protein